MVQLQLRFFPVWSLFSIVTKLCRIGTRPSPLAKVQAEAVAQELKKVNPTIDFLIQEISAVGDIEPRQRVIQNQPLALQSADFSSALDQALYEKEIDVAVHSFKDIPPTNRWHPSCSDFAWACPLPRKDPTDVLVGALSLESALENHHKDTIKIGTSSIRRQAQLNHYYHQLMQNCSSEEMIPKMELVNLRGNLESRLSMLKEGQVDTLILAKAGLQRLGKLADLKATELPTNVMLPGLCQGIIAAVFLKDLRLIIPNAPDTNIAAAGERALLNALDEASPWTGRPPLAGLMQRSGSGEWHLDALLARPDGTKVLTTTGQISRESTMAEAEALGTRLGLELKERAGSNFFER